jgi:quinoprotein dehydrogenase-associated probable ABC transporter substrate-binding protein
MFSRFRKSAGWVSAGVRWLILTLPVLALGARADAWVAAPTSPAVLRVCSDPNNLPFSNQREEGFENRIARVLAHELHARLEYTWAPEWRGFIRKTLGAHRCDMLMGVPAASDRVLPTRPYYTSTYVFLSRQDRGLRIRSLDDPVLRRLRIGIHFVGDDYTNPPPAHALGRRGIVNNVVGYSLYGDYSKPNPPAELVHAVAKGDVDLAIVWGPFAGYFGSREAVPLTLTPVAPEIDPPALRFTFPIAIGVRRDDTVLRARLDTALKRRACQVRRILLEYHVPLAESPGPTRVTQSLKSQRAACTS